MTRTWKTLFRRVGEFNARIEDNVGGIRVVQAFANEDHERELFAHNNAHYRTTKLEAYRIMTASMSLSYFSMRLAQIIVMIAGAYFVLHGRLTEGEFVTFLLLVGVFFRPMEKINQVLESYPKGIAGFRSYTACWTPSRTFSDAPDAMTVAGLRGDIRYENVTFGYGPEQHRPARHQPGDPRRRDGRLRRPIRRGQDDDRVAAAALLRDRRGPDHDRRHRHPADDAGLAAPRDRHRPAGCLPLRRHDPREHRLRPARRDRGGDPAKRSAAPGWRASSPTCRTGWTRSSASAASSSPAARSSASPSPACSSRTRRS